jgi:AcrR family transcriptional regulator
MSDQTEGRLSDALESRDGFVAPRYRSGQRSADALLEAGQALLARVSYEGLSVSELCKEAHLTSGAFYRRFQSKDAFFLALQRLALDDATRTKQMLIAQLDAGADPSLTLMACSRRVVDATRQWHLNHVGVVRASLQRRDHTPGSWQPFKEYGRGFVHDIASRMVKLPELRGRKDALARLTVGFQIVIGTMINSALNDPGPLRLDEPAMTDALATTLALYASADA